jgi:hypothetical protein
MNFKTKLGALFAVLALLVTPAAALAGGPEYAPAPEPKPKTPGPGASNAEKTKAYGVYCAGFSKAHVKGQAMTPFSRCVTAMAKAATTKKTARLACVGFSKAHVKGKTGTEFSTCVAAAAKVKTKVASR